MKKFLQSNKTRDRLLRTILQGVIGVLIANADVLVGPLTIPAEYKPVIAATIMAILSPVMSELGKANELGSSNNHAEVPACSADADPEEEDEYGND